MQVQVPLSVPVPTAVLVSVPVLVIGVLIGHPFSGESSDAVKTCPTQSETQ